MAFAVAGVIAFSSGAVSRIMVPDEGIKENSVYIEAQSASISKKSSGPEDISEAVLSADIELGKKKTKPCLACHNFEKGGRNGVGPNLWGVYGRDKGSLASFSYSKSMREFGGIWDTEELNKFLYKPKSYISGTKMAYAGIKNTKDRAAVIAYLKSLSE